MRKTLLQAILAAISCVLAHAPLEGGGVMLISLRNAFMSGTRKPSPTAKDYVQSGLSYLYDGIENAGWGQHDATQNGWVNLVDGTMPFVLTQSAETYFGLNYLHRSNTSGALRPNFQVVEANTTTELLVNVSADNSISDNARFIGASITNRRFEVDCYSSGVSNAPRLYWRMTGGTSQTTTFCRFQRASAWGLWALALTVDSSGVVTVKDTTTGASWSSGTSTVDVAYYVDNPAVIGCWVQGDKVYGQMICNIHRIARYNKVLSAEEIAHNYAIDKERFNLP